MKPITITVDKDNKPLVTLDELKQMLKDAYDEGYSDGCKNTAPITIYPYYPSNVEPWWRKLYIGDSTTPVYYTPTWFTDTKSTEGSHPGHSTTTTTYAEYPNIPTEACTTTGKSQFEIGSTKTVISHL